MVGPLLCRAIRLFSAPLLTPTHWPAIQAAAASGTLAVKVKHSSLTQQSFIADMQLYVLNESDHRIAENSGVGPSDLAAARNTIMNAFMKEATNQITRRFPDTTRNAPCVLCTICAASAISAKWRRSELAPRGCMLRKIVNLAGEPNLSGRGGN